MSSSCDGPYKIDYYEDGNVSVKYWKLNNFFSENFNRNKKRHDKYHGKIEYYNSGIIKKISLFVNNNLSWDDGPAVTKYYEDGTIKYEKWYVLWEVIKEKWYKDSNLHREDGPAYVKYAVFGGNVIKKKWYKDGNLHREDGPAYVKYEMFGDFVKEEWYKDGKLHRVNDPAITRMYPNGSSQDWVLNGKLQDTRSDIESDIESDMGSDTGSYYERDIKSPMGSPIEN